MATAPTLEYTASLAVVGANSAVAGKQAAAGTRVRMRGEASSVRKRQTIWIRRVAILGAIFVFGFLCCKMALIPLSCAPDRPTASSHVWHFVQASSPLPNFEPAGPVTQETPDNQVRVPLLVDTEDSNVYVGPPSVPRAPSPEDHPSRIRTRISHVVTCGLQGVAGVIFKLKDLVKQLWHAAGAWHRRTAEHSRWRSPRKKKKGAEGVSHRENAQNGEAFQFCTLPWWKWSAYYYSLLTIEDDKMRETKRVRQLARKKRWHMIRLLFVIAALPAKVLRKLRIERASAEKGLVLKVLVPSWLGSGEFMQEAFIHQLLWNHHEKFPFILPLLGVARSSTGSRNVYMILPKARTLRFALAGGLTYDFRLACAELLCAVKNLHDHGLVHRDLKVENVLVMPDGHLALSDFETVRQEGRMSTIAGTLSYMAPELRNRLERHLFFATVKKEQDLYSLGRTFKFMLDRVTEAGAPTRSSRGMLTDIILRMTSEQPRKRLILENVMKHPFFRELDFERVRWKEYGTPFFPLEQTSLTAHAGEYSPRSSLPSVAQLLNIYPRYR